MLFKEACLFRIYEIILRDDIKLFALVKRLLNERLAKDWPDNTVKNMKQYRKKLLAYMYSQDKANALAYSFWKVASESKLDVQMELLEQTKDHLFYIFNYNYKSIEEYYE